MVIFSVVSPFRNSCAIFLLIRKFFVCIYSYASNCVYSKLSADPDHKPVKKDDFAQHMALLRSDMEEGFKMEYESLDMAEWEFTQYNAKVTVNKNKNRYINIIPCKLCVHLIAVVLSMYSQMITAG